MYVCMYVVTAIQTMRNGRLILIDKKTIDKKKNKYFIKYNIFDYK